MLKNSFLDKRVIAGLTGIFSIFGGFILAEDRFNQNDEIILAEQKTAATLSEVQQSIIDMRHEFKIQNAVDHLNSCENRVAILRRELQRFPNDMLIIEDYDQAVLD